MNGIPLIFILCDDVNSGKYYLKFELETTVDKEFYGEEYDKTVQLCERLNKHPYCSYYVEKLNKIINHYTHDFEEFEYDEDNMEWHGNIC